jgi:hypothetical protein
MKKTITAVVIALVSIGAHAEDIGALQAKAIAKSKAAATATANAQATSDYIRAQVPLLMRDAMFAWFQKAQASGVKFDPVKLKDKDYDGNSNVDYTRAVIQSAYAGKFVYVQGCDELGTCEDEPTVQISGVDGQDRLSITYHSNTEPWSSDQWHPTNDWTCEISGFHGAELYKGPCGELLDKSERTANIGSIVANINAALPGVFK